MLALQEYQNNQSHKDQSDDSDNQAHEKPAPTLLPGLCDQRRSRGGYRNAGGLNLSSVYWRGRHKWLNAIMSICLWSHKLRL